MRILEKKLYSRRSVWGFAPEHSFASDGQIHWPPADAARAQKNFLVYLTNWYNKLVFQIIN